MNESELKETLRRHGQEQVLRWWEELGSDARAELARQVGQIEWDKLSLSAEDGRRGAIAPIEGLSVAEIAARKEEYFAIGRDAVRAGKAEPVQRAGQTRSCGPEQAARAGVM